MKFALRTLVLASAAVAGIAGSPTVLAASTSPAAERALANIATFPGRSLHGPGQTYGVRDVIVDADGTEHVRVDRQYRGLPVIGGDMVVHSTGRGTLLDISRTMNRLLMLETRPYVSEAMAVSVALGSRSGYAQSGRPQLAVYAREDLPELAYDVLVTGQRRDGTPSELHVIVDALRGKVLDAWDDIEVAAAAATGKGFFSGTVSLTTDVVSGTHYLRDPSRGNQYTADMGNRQGGSATIFTDANKDGVWGDFTLANRQTVGVDAQYGTAVTWDYYKNVHGRNGIANDGKGAYNRVHYGRGYNNAFWSNSCFCMTYGDGDGVTFNPFDSLDVAGHEMSHGVTSRSANLTYSGESGGLNEGTSDIFGTMVEYYAGNPNDAGDYYIGEKLYKSGTSALRSMIRPSADGASADCWYSGVGSLDVHYSSGVANHFFHLLAEGTSYGSPTCVAGNTRVATGSGTLTGIGRDKAAKIWYRALTVYMTSSTSYAGARTATIKAADDLYPAGSAESSAVAAAWTAVNRP